MELPSSVNANGTQPRLVRFRLDALVVALLVALAGTAYWLTLRPGQDWGSDFSQYIIHARNLATGRPYVESNYVVTFPKAGIHMPHIYPPVFPLVLAPVYRKFGLNYLALKLPGAAMFLVAAVVFYALARARGMNPLPAAFAMGAFTLSGLVLAVKDLILSDSTYLVLSGLTLLAMVLIDRNGWDDTKPVPSAAILTFLMVLSYGTRAVGLSLALAFALHEVLIKRRIRWFGAMVLGAFAVSVVWFAGSVFGERSYGTEFRPEIQAYMQNLTLYLRSPGSLWMGAPRAVRYVLLSLTVVAAATAWLRRLSTGASAVEFYLPAAILPLVLLSSGRSNRYFLPVAPLYFIYAMEGVAWLRERYLPGRSSVEVCACALLAMGSAFNLRGMEKGPYRQGVEQPSFIELSRFLRENVSENDLVISRHPRVVALHTDRRSAWYPEFSSDAEFDRYLADTGASYVLVYPQDEMDRQWLAPHINAQANRFVAVFRNADFQLYRWTGHP
jgi:hypothetical protein